MTTEHGNSITATECAGTVGVEQDAPPARDPRHTSTGPRSRAVEGGSRRRG